MNNKFYFVSLEQNLKASSAANILLFISAEKNTPNICSRRHFQVVSYITWVLVRGFQRNLW